MKQFEDLYNEINNNEELNNAWKQAREEEQKIKKVTLPIHIVISLILLVVMIKSIGFNFMGMLPIIIMIIFANLIIFVVSMFFRKKQREYGNVFKNIIIKELINNFYNNVEYFPNKQIPSRIYDEPKYNEYYNRYHSDDYIEAKINNKYDISMAEVKTEKVETKRDKDGNTHTTTTTKFHGIFAKIVIDKSIKSELKIEQNGKFVFSKKRLEMDSSEFEKYFDVSATNKIIGMQLLTVDIMEELIDFVNKTNMKYDIVINNNNIYLRFHSGTMFETGSLKKGAVDKDMMQKYFYMLNFTYNLADKIIKLINETEI
ncbi:MAG: DUF3137 domain-containing protein [Clostridia bacterium]|nr:DUF3137 domain-containing protein [Clostridia bacterium]